MKKNYIAPTLFWLVMVFFPTACAGPVRTVTPVPTFPVQASLTPAPSATPTWTPTPTHTPIPSPTTSPIPSLGQLVRVNNLTLALIGVEYTPDQLQVTFVAENLGPAITNPSFQAFSAVSSGGAKLKEDVCTVSLSNKRTVYGVPPFAGLLQPGEILRGTICWKRARPQDGVRVYYMPGDSLKTTFWDVSQAGKADPPTFLVTNDFITPPLREGEGVVLNDISVTFDELTLTDIPQQTQQIVSVQFTIGNNGSSSYKFNGALSSSFSLKLADGSPLYNEFMKAGCQNAQTRVEVLPGQKQSLRLCYLTPPGITLAPGALIRFLPDPDQGEMVIWVAK